NRVRNPIAHADGGVSEGLGKKIDPEKLKEASLDVFQARKKLKAMFEEFKSNIKTCEMPKLAYYKRIGYGSAADYRGFGQQIWEYPYVNSKRNQKNWDIKQSKNFATNAAWEKWSEGYYPQKMTNLYNDFNEFFTIYYPQRVLEIAETTDTEEKTKKENELKEYLQSTLLDKYIKSIIREGEEDYQNIFDCIKTFVLFPKQVLEHQYNYVMEIERQEGTNAAAMKSYANDKHTMFNTGNFCDTIDAINYIYSKINSDNREKYQKALSLLNNRGFSEVLDDNIVIAHNFIKNFEAVDVGITISQDYTDNVATADVNQTGLQYGSGGNKSTTSDRNMLLIGVGLLAVLLFIKKKKK
ncbi:MAG: hypothetical protein ACI3Z9_04245, partial [Candidatus Onthomorpha sp.]